MTKEVQRPEVGIGAYVFKEGKLLLGKRKNSHGEGYYATPGGSLEHMESLIQCAERETFEETGLIIKDIRPIRVENITAFAPRHFIDIALYAEWKAGEPMVREQDKIEGWNWYDIDNLPEPLFTPIPSALEALKSNEWFWDTTQKELSFEIERLHPLQIYFSTAIQGGNNFREVKERISFLQTIGNVLTKHMANESTVDAEFTSTTELYAFEETLIEKTDVYIADFSKPSSGGGFMAREAISQGKPALCLFHKDQKPSAMLDGCPGVSVDHFSNQKEFRECVFRFLIENTHKIPLAKFKSPKIFIAGLPGSGKGTLSKKLNEKLGTVHVSTGELCRSIVSKGEHKHAQTIKRHMEAGDLVPADVMRDIVVDTLAQPECLVRGFILDGYPPSKDDLKNLQEHNIKPDVVLYLECSDNTAVSRQVARSERSTDTKEKAQQRIDVFKKAEADFASLTNEWYPESIVARINAEQIPQLVEETAIEIVKNLLQGGETTHSFFPIPPCKAEERKSDRVHFHIDAANSEKVLELAKRVYEIDKSAQGNMKVYPIHSLYLGPQTKEYPVYEQMPNFHTINNSETEAFITGTLGDGNTSLMLAVLQAASEQGGMVEMEEYLCEHVLTKNGESKEVATYTPLGLHFMDKEYRKFDDSLCSNIPKYELHLGFDLPKSNYPYKPIALDVLTELCNNKGFNNGGWFIFHKEDAWAYRSNEFTNIRSREALKKLTDQACALREILLEKDISCDISYSLEIVHNIWTFSVKK